MRQQTSMWADERLDLDGSLALTAESLRAYGERFNHWAIAYSGGKDSSATVTVVLHLIESGQVPAPKTLTVLYADTRLELTPLHFAALQMLSMLRDRGIDARMVLPEMQDRFFVYMFGRGVPAPKNNFRWCTAQLKIEPMERELEDLRARCGEKLLMLTGVRIGESAKRDAKIVTSCSRDGAECGQGWFQEMTPDSIADTLAPLLHWRVCLVWDWLMFHAPSMGFPTTEIAEVYGVDEEGSAAEIGARTGCVGCNLASRDNALERILQQPKWGYLAPLLRLRPLYAELQKPHNRLRKNAEVKKDGTPSSNPYRMGPYTMEARRYGLAEVMSIQNEINSAAAVLGRPTISLIDTDEYASIMDLMEANTWPDGWTGTEMRGDAFLNGGDTDHYIPLEITRRGGKQIVMSGFADEVTA